jgi:hypothetical protein
MDKPSQPFRIVALATGVAERARATRRDELGQPVVAVVHVRNARPGCYACAIERAEA